MRQKEFPIKDAKNTAVKWRSKERESREGRVKEERSIEHED